MVVVSVVVMPATDDHGCGEQDGGCDEYDPGDDHHPGGDYVKTRRLFPVLRPGRRRGGNRRRCSGRFGCFTHTFEYGPGPQQRKGARSQSCRELMKPGARVERRAVGLVRSATGCGRRGDGRADRGRHLGGSARSAGSVARTDLLRPTIGGESRAVHHRRVVLVVAVSAAMPGGQAQPEAGEEDDRDDEDDPGDDGYPRRGLENLGRPVFDPLNGRWWGYCGRSPRSGGVRNFAHATNDRGRTVVTAMRWLCTSCEHESDPDLAGSGTLRRRAWTIDSALATAPSVQDDGCRRIASSISTDRRLAACHLRCDCRAMTLVSRADAMVAVPSRPARRVVRHIYSNRPSREPVGTEVLTVSERRRQAWLTRSTCGYSSLCTPRN